MWKEIYIANNFALSILICFNLFENFKFETAYFFEIYSNTNFSYSFLNFYNNTVMKYGIIFLLSQLISFKQS